MRSTDNDSKISNIKSAFIKGEIPDQPGVEAGLCGLKAPAGYKQEGDIRDRLLAAGKLKDAPIPFVVRN